VFPALSVAGLRTITEVMQCDLTLHLVIICQNKSVVTLHPLFVFVPGAHPKFFAEGGRGGGLPRGYIKFMFDFKHYVIKIMS
jgi:hypothetical protein